MKTVKSIKLYYWKLRLIKIENYLIRSQSVVNLVNLIVNRFQKNDTLIYPPGLLFNCSLMHTLFFSYVSCCFTCPVNVIEIERNCNWFKLSGLSESFDVDGWVIKVSSRPGLFYFKNVIHKEMPSRVTGR